MSRRTAGCTTRGPPNSSVVMVLVWGLCSCGSPPEAAGTDMVGATVASTEGDGTQGAASSGPTGGGEPSGTDTSSASATSGPAESCGDGVVDSGEDCDDGNAVEGDGCNTDCVVSGTLLWRRTHDGPEALGDRANGIAIGPAGLVITGRQGFNHPEPHDPVSWTAHYDFEGELVWERRDDVVPGTESGMDVACQETWCVVLGAIPTRPLLIALDWEGELLWSLADTEIGTPDDNDRLQEVSWTPGFPIVVTAANMSKGLFEADMVVASVTAEGTPAGSTSWHAGAGLAVFADWIARTPRGQVVVAGRIGPEGGLEAWMAWLQPTGVPQVQVGFEFEGEVATEVSGIDVCPNGDVVANVGAGGIRFTRWLWRLAEGQEVWSFEAVDTVEGAVACGSDGSVVTTTEGGIAKYDAAGMELWRTQVDGDVEGLAVAADGTIYGAGTANTPPKTDALVFAVAP